MVCICYAMLFKINTMYVCMYEDDDDVMMLTFFILLVGLVVPFLLLLLLRTFFNFCFVAVDESIS